MRKFAKTNPLSRYPGAKIIRKKQSKRSSYTYTGVVVEFPPAVRPILSRGRAILPDLRQLAFPYVYLVIQIIDDTAWKNYVFYRNTAPTSEDQKLYLPNLPNVVLSGEVCMRHLTQENGEPLEEFVGRIVEEFWTSPFNDDILEAWSFYQRREGFPRTISEWEMETRRDPNFFTQLQLAPVIYTFESIEHSFLG